MKTATMKSHYTPARGPSVMRGFGVVRFPRLMVCIEDEESLLAASATSVEE